MHEDHFCPDCQIFWDCPHPLCCFIPEVEQCLSCRFSSDATEGEEVNDPKFTPEDMREMVNKVKRHVDAEFDAILNETTATEEHVSVEDEKVLSINATGELIDEIKRLRVLEAELNAALWVACKNYKELSGSEQSTEDIIAAAKLTARSIGAVDRLRHRARQQPLAL